MGVCAYGSLGARVWVSGRPCDLPSSGWRRSGVRVRVCLCLCERVCVCLCVCVAPVCLCHCAALTKSVGGFLTIFMLFFCGRGIAGGVCTALAALRRSHLLCVGGCILGVENNRFGQNKFNN